VSVRVMAAPGTRAPVESFTVPRSEVVAFWANDKVATDDKVAAERIQKSIHPHRDFFTATPPENSGSKVWPF